MQLGRVSLFDVLCQWCRRARVCIMTPTNLHVLGQIMRLVLILVNLTFWALGCATTLQHFHKLQGKDLSHWQAFSLNRRKFEHLSLILVLGILKILQLPLWLSQPPTIITTAVTTTTFKTTVLTSSTLTTPVLISSTFTFWRISHEIRFGAAISDAVMCSSTVFCNSQSLQIAFHWLCQGCLAPRLCA